MTANISRWCAASNRLGTWMSAALDDPDVCEAMKQDIREWFAAANHLSPPSPKRTRKMADEQGAIPEALERLFDQAFTDGIAAGKSGDESILAGSSAVYARSALTIVAADRLTDTGEGLPTDRYGMTVLDRMRDTAENGTMPPECRKDLFALLDLVTPTDATDGATGGGEVPTGVPSQVPSSASHDDDEHGGIVTMAYMMGAKDERDRHAKATTPGGDLLEQAARVAYRICAEARHVTLGDKAAAAIRALKPAGDGGEA